MLINGYIGQKIKEAVQVGTSKRMKMKNISLVISPTKEDFKTIEYSEIIEASSTFIKREMEDIRNS
jgi:hypothetical protein